MNLNIPKNEKTPLVKALLGIIDEQQKEIDYLKDKIIKLKEETIQTTKLNSDKKDNNEEKILKILDIINTPLVTFMIPFIGFNIYFLYNGNDFSILYIITSFVFASVPSYFVALALTALFSAIDYMYYSIE